MLNRRKKESYLIRERTDSPTELRSQSPTRLSNRTFPNLLDLDLLFTTWDSHLTLEDLEHSLVPDLLASDFFLQVEAVQVYRDPSDEESLTRLRCLYLQVCCH